MKKLIKQALHGERLAIAKLLTLAENQHPSFIDASSVLFQNSGNAYRIGITGAPGTGKSTLTSKLAQAIRKSGKTVGILAIDPSSPLTGGALLGDRIRMRELYGDKGVFIRSMASRGALGGIARTTADAAMVLDAAGFDIIMIETVGAGQAEVEIATLAHTVIVVESPGFGDDIQAIKAGILEIADILVVNKADLPGVLRTENALMSAFNSSKKHVFRHHSDIGVESNKNQLAVENPGWQVPILRTEAINNEGIQALLETVLTHQQHLIKNELLQQVEKQRLQFEYEEHLRNLLFQQWKNSLTEQERFEQLNALANRKVSPQKLAQEQLTKR